MRKIALVYFVQLAHGVNSACYTPDGGVSKDVSCSPDGSPSICCTSGLVCLSNFLCSTKEWVADEKNWAIRGTCTDKTWKDPACGKFCQTENPSGGEYVYQCDKGGSDNMGTFCCASESCCTDPAAEKFRMLNGVIYRTAGAPPPPISTLSTSISKDGGSTQSSSAISRPTSNPSVGGTTSGPATSSTTGSPNTNTTTTPEPANSNNNNTSSLGLGLGVGIGVGAIAVALCGGFFFLWNRRRKNIKPPPEAAPPVIAPVITEAEKHPQEMSGAPVSELYTQYHYPHNPNEASELPETSNTRYQ